MRKEVPRKERGELESWKNDEDRGWGEGCMTKGNSKPVSGVGTVSYIVVGFKDQVGSFKAFVSLCICGNMTHVSCSLMYPQPLAQGLG